MKNFLSRLSFLVYFWAQNAFAQQGQDGQRINLVNPLNCNDFACVTEKIVGFLLFIAAPLATILVLVGGFQMMTAGGDPEKFARGKRTLLYAAVGLVVVLAAQGVEPLIRDIFGGPQEPVLD